MPRFVTRSLPFLTVFACVAALRAGAPQAPAGRALKIEDYYRVQSVGGPAFSPNSKWVSYTVSTRFEEEENGTRSESWIVASEGSSAPRRIQHEGKDVSNPRWTDDGWLQYAVDRQQWKINPESPSGARVLGEAAPATGCGGDGAGGRAAAAPSPDGKWTRARSTGRSRS